MNIILRIFLLFMVFTSFAGLFSSAHWFLDLFNHFRLQVIIANIVLWIFLSLSRRRFQTLAIFMLVLNLILFMIPILKTKDNPHEFSQVSLNNLKIIFANMNSNNKNYFLAVNKFVTANPDIIALVEINDECVEGFSSLKALYPHVLKYPRSDNFGIAVYSKKPFKGEIINMGAYELPLAKLNFENFTLMVVHPFPPISEIGFQENKIYLEGTVRLSLYSKQAVIVIGDFNCTLWGGALKPLIDSGLKRANRMGVGFTWPSYFPPLAIQIDHAFVRNVTVKEFKILNTIGSDHYPIQLILN